MLTYIAKEIEEIEYQPNAWHGLRVGVFRVENGSEEQIGEYERNYGILYNTFFHFKQNGKDFALYSPDYTVTRIMEVPSCKDIGGEEPNSFGFCPVDYLVPSYINVERESKLDGQITVIRRNQPEPSDFKTETYETVSADSREIKSQIAIRPITPLLYYPFGFVAGCIWGDDGSWKIQYLDLSEAEKGLIRREEKFGYIDMPSDLTLEQAIDTSNFGYTFDGKTYNRIKIAVARGYDMDSNQWIDQQGIE